MLDRLFSGGRRAIRRPGVAWPHHVKGRLRRMDASSTRTLDVACIPRQVGGIASWLHAFRTIGTTDRSSEPLHRRAHAGR
jgi:hypothetical protein